MGVAGEQGRMSVPQRRERLPNQVGDVATKEEGAVYVAASLAMIRAMNEERKAAGIEGRWTPAECWELRHRVDGALAAQGRPEAPASTVPFYPTEAAPQPKPVRGPGPGDSRKEYMKAYMQKRREQGK